LQSTDALVDEFLKSPNPESFTPVHRVMGRNGGTFVIRKLVYNYAMWISPAFHFKVVDFFDRGVTQGVVVADHAAEDLLKNPLKYLEAIIGQAKELQEKLLVAQPKADHH
jgi:hypothetical protein